MTNLETKFSKVLSICIPTFNRPQKISDLLELLISQIENHDIEIIITDNSNNNLTKEKLKLFIDQNRNITYYKNDANIGFAKNLRKAISMSNGKYIWMLGDDDIPNHESVKKILSIINSSTNGWIFFNFEKSSSDSSEYFYDNSIPSGQYDFNRFIYQFGIWTSFMSASILSSDIKKHIDEVAENDYYAFSLALLAGKLYGCSFINFPLIKREVDDLSKHRFDRVETYLFDFFEPIDDLIDSGDISKKTRNSLVKEFFHGIIPVYLYKIKLNKHLMPPIQLVYKKHKESLFFYSNILPIYLIHPILLRVLLMFLKRLNYIFQIKKIKRLTDFLLS